MNPFFLSWLSYYPVTFFLGFAKIASMSTKTPPHHVRHMFDQIASRYDRLNRILSLGIDRYWRKQLIRHLPMRTPLSLLDLATGTCDQLITLMRTNRFYKAIGVDVANEMLEVGRKKLSKTPYAEYVTLHNASALEIPSQDETFDCVTISFGIRNVDNALDCLKEMHRVMKKEGRAFILEFSLPKNKALKRLYLVYLRHILPFLGALFSGKKSPYTYLNKTIESFPYGTQFLALMEDAGFKKAEAFPMTFGIATLYVGTKQ